MSSVLKAHLALFAVALIYGANYSIAKVAMDDGHVPPLAFILLRGVSATSLFWVFHWLFVRERVERRDMGRMALCALTGVSINQMFFFSGLKLTTPINAALMMTTSPILVLLVSAIMLREPITLRKMTGIAVGAAGAILLIAYGQQVSFNRESLLGDLLIFLNASSYGIYLVLVKSLMMKYHPITVVRWTFTLGLIGVIPFGIGDLFTIEWSSFSPAIWGSVVYVLIFTTFLAYLFNAYALREVNATVAGIYIYLQPLLATIAALLLSSDQLTPVKFMAGGLIFAGVYLVSWRR